MTLVNPTGLQKMDPMSDFSGWKSPSKSGHVDLGRRKSLEVKSFQAIKPFPFPTVCQNPTSFRTSSATAVRCVKIPGRRRRRHAAGSFHIPDSTLAGCIAHKGGRPGCVCPCMGVWTDPADGICKNETQPKWSRALGRIADIFITE